MKFILDECMPRSSNEILKLLKLDFLDSEHAGLLGKSDMNYIIFARRTNRILITLDKDFSNILMYKPGNNPGIVVLRPNYPITSIKVDRLLYKFLKKAKRLNIEKTLVVVTPAKIRIRK